MVKASREYARIATRLERITRDYLSRRGNDPYADINFSFQIEAELKGVRRQTLGRLVDDYIAKRERLPPGVAESILSVLNIKYQKRKSASGEKIEGVDSDERSS